MFRPVKMFPAMARFVAPRAFPKAMPRVIPRYFSAEKPAPVTVEVDATPNSQSAQYILKDRTIYSHPLNIKQLDTPIYASLPLPIIGLTFTYFGHPIIGGTLIFFSIFREAMVYSVRKNVNRTIRSIDFNADSKTVDLTTFSGDTQRDIPIRDITWDLSMFKGNYPLAFLKLKDGRSIPILLNHQYPQATEDDVLKLFAHNQYDELEKYSSYGQDTPKQQ